MVSLIPTDQNCMTTKSYYINRTDSESHFKTNSNDLSSLYVSVQKQAKTKCHFDSKLGYSPNLNLLSYLFIYTENYTYKLESFPLMSMYVPV